MPTPPPDDLTAFLLQQPHEALVKVLQELATEHAPVRDRLARLQLSEKPDALAAELRKTLSGWRRSTRFIDYRESRAFASELDAWLEDVRSTLQPRSPPAALKLFEAFIESDGKLIDRCDDSGGYVGDSIRLACRYWLDAAKQCPAPSTGWPARLAALYDADEIGTREALLEQADRLLDRDGLLLLVGRYEDRMTAVLTDRAAGEAPPIGVFRESGALTLLSQALKDPDIRVRAVLRYSPQPNELQKESFARAYLAADRPADALPWLQDPWPDRGGGFDLSRRRMLAKALASLGRRDESASLLQSVFEQSIASEDLQAWLEQLPGDRRDEALASAKASARDHPDASAAAALLLVVGEATEAEDRLVRAADSLPGEQYGTLVPLAARLREHGCSRGETAVHRALLTALLGRGYAKAYPHGARYLMRLREIAATGESLAPLVPHAIYEEVVRERHGRKTSFWAEVRRLEQAAGRKT